MLTCINCGGAFASERLTPCKAQLVPMGGNFLFIKIKIKCNKGQNLEIMTFRYIKTLVFDKCFKELQHYLMFLF